MCCTLSWRCWLCGSSLRIVYYIIYSSGHITIQSCSIICIGLQYVQMVIECLYLIAYLHIRLSSTIVQTYCTFYIFCGSFLTILMFMFYGLQYFFYKRIHQSAVHLPHLIDVNRLQLSVSYVARLQLSVSYVARLQCVWVKSKAIELMISIFNI